MATPIVLDCDPGHDDAIALLLALAAREIEVRAVTTVGGNQTLEKTTRNARQILTVAGRTDVPVSAGMADPILRDLMTAGFVHGESGLDGPALPDPEGPLDERHAVEVIADAAREAEEPLTLVPTGPLTNVAMALSLYPDLVDELDQIVLMGGGYREGNVTPVAEFNIRVDPEAAAVVFHADVDVTMVGLDVTRAGRLPVDRFDEFRAMDTEVATLVADLLDFYVHFHTEKYGWDAVPIHDACAVAEVIEPGIVETESMYVAVETDGTHTDGQTVCDRWGVTEREPNAEVGLDIDAPTFHEMLFEAIATY